MKWSFYLAAYPYTLICIMCIDIIYNAIMVVRRYVFTILEIRLLGTSMCCTFSFVYQIEVCASHDFDSSWSHLLHFYKILSLLFVPPVLRQS